MRNSTMADKLSAVLGTPSPRAIPLRSKDVLVNQAKRGVGQFRAALRNAPPLSQAATSVSRYTIPPKRRNPFSVHAYPVIEIPEPVEQVSEPVQVSELASSKLGVRVSKLAS